MRNHFTAKPTLARTKGEVKRLRLQGFTLISIQHRGQETRHYQEEARPLDEFIQQHGEAGLMEMMIEPEHVQETVIIHEVQRDAISRRLLHVTFQSVRKDELLKVSVPLVAHGEPEAVKLGTAMLRQPIEMIEIRCLPADLPDHLSIDISHLNFGEVLRVSDLPASEKYEILTPANAVLVSLGSLTNRSSDDMPETAVPAATEAAAAV